MERSGTDIGALGSAPATPSCRIPYACRLQSRPRSPRRHGYASRHRAPSDRDESAAPGSDATGLEPSPSPDPSGKPSPADLRAGRPPRRRPRRCGLCPPTRSGRLPVAWRLSDRPPGCWLSRTTRAPPPSPARPSGQSDARAIGSRRRTARRPGRPARIGSASCRASSAARSRSRRRAEGSSSVTQGQDRRGLVNDEGWTTRAGWVSACASEKFRAARTLSENISTSDHRASPARPSRAPGERLMTHRPNRASRWLLTLLLAVTVLPLCHTIQAMPKWEVGFALLDDERNEFRIFNLDGLPVTWRIDRGGRLVERGTQAEFVRTIAGLGYTGCRERWTERR